MQEQPEKIAGNYNEFPGPDLRSTLQVGAFAVTRAVEQPESEPQEIITTGVRLVNAKIDAILGNGNKLTREDLAFPDVRFIATFSEKPDWAGYFSPASNAIGIVMDKTRDKFSRTKVFIHEYIHFLSHNGRDDDELLYKDSPLARNNNVGFSRNFGLDIRSGKEGEWTSDYFLAFNEAVTEQLAIDILPGVHETYSDYRGLLQQVIDDAVTRGLGSRREDGSHQAWSGEQLKSYIYQCFFKGDLEGFTGLLKNIYKKYDISEQQFGLMTHRDDLPSVIEVQKRKDDPSGPPPPPAEIAIAVQLRLDSKTPDDYQTDIIGPDPNGDGNSEEDIYGSQYDAFVKEHGIAFSHKQVIEGRDYDFDNMGYRIYKTGEAATLLRLARSELDSLLSDFSTGKITVEAIITHMDKLLFENYGMSMLSDGFRDFYIHKHARIDNL